MKEIYKTFYCVILVSNIHYKKLTRQRTEPGGACQVTGILTLTTKKSSVNPRVLIE